MGDNVEDTNLTDVVVAQPVIADQNELIMQLMQQIAEMRIEIQRRQDSPNPAFVPTDGRPPLHFPPSNTGQTQNPPPTIFQISVPNEHDANGSELDHYEEWEREWRSKEEAAKLDMKEEIRKAMKELQCIPEVAGLNYEDLCIHPNLDLLEGFKVPKFDVFGGTGNPLAHLRAYCDQLVGVGRDEALLMRLFSRSLSGEALEWFTSHETRQWPSWNALAKDFIERFAYNVKIVPDRYSLEKMKQKSNESYREFAYRWRKDAARVRPPMSEKEIVEVFVRVQEPEYYDRIMLLVGAKFAEIVKVGETIEDGLKQGRLRVLCIAGSSSLLKKKREDVSAVSFEGKKTPRKFLSYQDSILSLPKYHPNCAMFGPNYQAPLTYQTPAPLYQNTIPNYQAPQPNYQIHSYPRYQAPRPNAPNYRQMPPSQQENYDPPYPRFEKKSARIFTPLVESRTKLFERLNAAGYIHPVGPKPVDTNSKFYRPDQRCAYHSNNVGHDTEDCINLKHEIQDLIDQKVAALVPRETLARSKFVIETAVAQGMTRSAVLRGRRKMQPKDYSIVKHLEKTPAQISVWALLMSSQVHR
ncbi:hypothetical protein R3W88_012134 [Solanum pinnatisectum]|uniref:Retrotransposon gag domain-containing protein n=1 Tax=Solanum pinnatisectum TaxID=50273 RepID=A0AAV9L825_9SOLN|nr:hypothetical protein R3W88_012134 [Solanum pinnatisectum]